MSDVYFKNIERKTAKWSRNMEKYRKKQIRYYLKKVRFRVNRRRRRVFYGLFLAVFVYLAGVWHVKDKIWSVRESEVIEYEMSKRGSTEEMKTVTKIRFHIKTGELEILHERSEPEK